MRRAYALFLAWQLAGCASRPPSSADPGPPILISDSLELDPEADAKRSAAVPQALAEALFKQLLEPSSSTPPAPNRLINNYLWGVFVPRPRSADPTQRYNPAYAGDREQAYRSDAANAELASKIWRVSRSPQALRRNFEAHKAWLYATLSRERYRLLGLDTYVNELLRVEAHLFKSKNADKVLREIHTRLARGNPGEREFPFPSRSNAHRAAYFGDLYDQAVEQRVIKQRCSAGSFRCRAASVELALWLHTFWYRRHLEENRAEVSKILKEIQVHYR